MLFSSTIRVFWFVNGMQCIETEEDMIVESPEVSTLKRQNIEELFTGHSKKIKSTEEGNNGEIKQLEQSTSEVNMFLKPLLILDFKNRNSSGGKKIPISENNHKPKSGPSKLKFEKSKNYKRRESSELKTTKGESYKNFSDDKCSKRACLEKDEVINESHAQSHVVTDRNESSTTQKPNQCSRIKAIFWNEFISGKDGFFMEQISDATTQTDLCETAHNNIHTPTVNSPFTKAEKAHFRFLQTLYRFKIAYDERKNVLYGPDNFMAIHMHSIIEFSKILVNFRVFDNISKSEISNLNVEEVKQASKVALQGFSEEYELAVKTLKAKMVEYKQGRGIYGTTFIKRLNFCYLMDIKFHWNSVTRNALLNADDLVEQADNSSVEEAYKDQLSFLRSLFVNTYNTPKFKSEGKITNPIFLAYQIENLARCHFFHVDLITGKALKNSLSSRIGMNFIIFFSSHQKIKKLLLPELNSLEYILKDERKRFFLKEPNHLALVLFTLSNIEIFFDILGSQKIENICDDKNFKTSNLQMAVTIIFIRKFFIVTLFQCISMPKVVLLRYLCLCEQEFHFMLKNIDTCSFFSENFYNPYNLSFFSFFFPYIDKEDNVSDMGDFEENSNLDSFLTDNKHRIIRNLEHVTGLGKRFDTLNILSKQLQESSEGCFPSETWVAINLELNKVKNKILHC